MKYRTRLNSCKNRRGGGFTLIELLISIAIVAVLAVLLFTASGRALRSAKSATCAGNLRGIASGMGIFAADHNGSFVASKGVGGYYYDDYLGTGPLGAAAYFTSDSASIRNKKYLFSPSIPMSAGYKSWFAGYTARLFTNAGKIAGYQGSLQGPTVGYVPYGIHNIEQPQKTVAYSVNFTKKEYLKALQELGWINTLFVDGHVESLRLSEDQWEALGRLDAYNSPNDYRNSYLILEAAAGHTSPKW